MKREEINKSIAENPQKKFNRGDSVRFTYQEKTLEGVVMRVMPGNRLDVHFNGANYYIQGANAGVIKPAPRKPV